ncbi:MAG: hypothetical protein ABI222_03480 [Opitutaceae bacterium]
MKKLALALILAAQLGVSAHAQTSGMEVGVRSGIDNAEKAKRDHDSAYAKDDAKRLRVYLLASVKEVKTDEKLVKSGNARAIADELRKDLGTRGFRPVGPGEKPEIVITVLYGRGMLLNPYIDPNSLGVGDFRAGKTGPPNISNSASNTNVFTHDIFVGLEAKAASLNYEKLAIQVTAMKYPPPRDPKEKPEILWQTAMYADDPDHRDLNAIMPTLLASGTPYFDRSIDREKEVKLYAPLPEGHVKVGTPEVVDAPKK